MAKSKVMQYLGGPVKFVGGRMAHSDISDPSQVAKGDGAVFDYNGQKVAVYRDENDNVFAMSAVCRHLGCIVGWNGEDKTWDCPCHGSRYAHDGKVIQGPAKKNLPSVEV